MKKIPYGNSSYDSIKKENYYYIDKTRYIEILENYGSKYHFFLRPRRFGKSLFVSILEHYYDICKKDQFDVLFGDTYIGKNPTPLKNSYPVLRFNFSMVSSSGTIENIKHSFLVYITGEISAFLRKYSEIFHLDLKILEKIEQQSDAGDVLTILYTELKIKHVSLFLLIDEYDNFGNNILIEHGKETYIKATHGGGFLRSFFAIIKGLTDNREIDRLFITGVSPLVMADVTSGFNIGHNISQDPQLVPMIGISHTEMNELVSYYNSCDIFKQSTESIISDFDIWYNGYSFNEKLERVYNTTSVLYYIQQYEINKKAPDNMIDENMRTDYGKFRFLLTEDNKLNGNFSVLREILEKKETSGTFVRSFALNELIDSEKFKSLLFYLGFTSVKETNPFGLYVYNIPNKLISTLLWEFIQKSITEVYELRMNRDFLVNAFAAMALKGEWKPTLQYIIDRFYEAVSIRDFVFHEEGIKTFLLAWLNMANYFKVTSEKELNQGFADIYLEPDRRHGDYVKYGYIIEMKYIKAADLKSKIKKDAAVANAIKEAKVQLQQYSDYERCTTIKIIVVASAKKLLYMECTN